MSDKKEYIERKALMRFPIRLNHYDKEHGNEHFVLGIESVLEYAESLPAADVEVARHGKWLPVVIQESYFDPPYCDTCKCSMCEYEIDVSETVYSYCPNCGAKMDGGKK